MNSQLHVVFILDNYSVTVLCVFQSAIAIKMDEAEWRSAIGRKQRIQGESHGKDSGVAGRGSQGVNALCIIPVVYRIHLSHIVVHRKNYAILVNIRLNMLIYGILTKLFKI